MTTPQAETEALLRLRAALIYHTDHRSSERAEHMADLDIICAALTPKPSSNLPKGKYVQPGTLRDDPLTPKPVEPTQAAQDVLAERERQKAVEGWHATHDDNEHSEGQLAKAAACYALSAASQSHGTFLRFWPWAESWWKPTTPRRDLVKAGALILAEIERIDRSAK